MADIAILYASSLTTFNSLTHPEAILRVDTQKPFDTKAAFVLEARFYSIVCRAALTVAMMTSQRAAIMRRGFHAHKESAS